MKCPCTKDCPYRSCNCRSVCREFKEYDQQRMEGYAERDRQRAKAHDTTKKERFNMLLLAATVSAGAAWLLLKWLEAIEYDEE